MSDEPHRLGYLPALDGIRALAILLVVASHAHPTMLKGGSLGVDVFFALSGFLITSLILEELRAGGGRRYAFVRFYARRSLRLFPALYAAVAVVALYLVGRRSQLAGFLETIGVDEPYPWTTWGKFVGGAATYTTNLIGVTATPGNLLGHTWSLALEEQFYLIWPILLVTAGRRGRRPALMGLLLTFIGVCLLCRLAGVPADRGFLWMRPEAIAAGSLAAMLRWDAPTARRYMERWASPVLSAGSVMIVGLAIARNRFIEGAVFDRGLLTAFGLVSAAVVWALLLVSESHWVRRVLERPCVVSLGMISYGWYIWHVPVFRIVTYELPHLPGAVNVVVKSAVSLVVAVASARFIERPFRQMQGRFRSSDLSLESGERERDASGPGVS